MDMPRLLGFAIIAQTGFSGRMIALGEVVSGSAQLDVPNAIPNSVSSAIMIS